MVIIPFLIIALWEWPVPTLMVMLVAFAIYLVYGTLYLSWHGIMKLKKRLQRGTLPTIMDELD